MPLPGTRNPAPGFETYKLFVIINITIHILLSVKSSRKEYFDRNTSFFHSLPKNDFLLGIGWVINFTILILYVICIKFGEDCRVFFVKNMKTDDGRSYNDGPTFHVHHICWVKYMYMTQVTKKCVQYKVKMYLLSQRWYLDSCAELYPLFGFPFSLCLLSWRLNVCNPF